MKRAVLHIVDVSIALLLLLSLASGQSLHISRVTTRPDGRQIGTGSRLLSMSDSGRYAIVQEFLSPTPPSFLTYDVRLLDRTNGSQAPLALGTGGVPLDSEIFSPLLTPAGNRVVFFTFASNVPGGITLPFGALLSMEVSTGLLTRLDHAAGGGPPDSYSFPESVSTDGRFVSCWSDATDLVPGDTNAATDAYVIDQQTGIITRLSLSTGGSESMSTSWSTHLSENGRYATFDNDGDDLDPADQNGTSFDVYFRDTQTGLTELISVTPSGVSGNAGSYGLWVSDDGRYVAFWSDATDLVAGDVNGQNDIFLRDRQLGTTTLVILSSSGAQLNAFAYGTFSGNGRYFAFRTSASNAVFGDTNQDSDIFVRDLLAGTTQRVTLTPTGGESHMNPFPGITHEVTYISNDGRLVSCHTYFGDLIAGDSNDHEDGFVIDRASNVAPVTTYCTAKTTSTGCTPVITSAGEPRASGFDSFYVSATQVRTATRGAFIWSLVPVALPFGGGTLCVAPPYQFQGVSSGTYGGLFGPCGQGQFVFQATQSFFGAHGILPGMTVYAQFMSRDNGYPAPNNIGLTDAITFTLAP